MNITPLACDSPKTNTPSLSLEEKDDCLSIFSEASSADSFSPWDANQIQDAIRIFLSGGQIASSSSKDIEILSIHNRGVTLSSWNDSISKRSIIRISPWDGRTCRKVTAKDISGPRQCGERILLFGRSAHSSSGGGGDGGIVPFIAPPKVIKNAFVVEQYEELLFDGTSRLDLHTFLVDDGGGANGDARQGFAYLHDVLVGIKSMHSSGWAHLDLSLENVVLSNDGHAYIVDFESALPFATQENGCISRKHFNVPVKAPFVPPEHFLAGSDDLLSLPSYDVWAFGIMFFTVLFREYLFACHRTQIDKRQRLCPMKSQIEYFMKHGFRRFMRKYHPEKHMLLFRPELDKTKKLDRRTCSYLTMCGDLLANIFRRPCRISVQKDGGGCSTVHGVKTPGRSENSFGGGVYFCDCTRFTAQDVYDHPFWEMHHIRDRRQK